MTVASFTLEVAVVPGILNQETNEEVESRRITAAPSLPPLVAILMLLIPAIRRHARGWG